MLTVRQTPVGKRTEQYVGGTIETDAELAVWAEATGHALRRTILGESYAVLATVANGAVGGVTVRRGSFVSWWVTV